MEYTKGEWKAKWDYLGGYDCMSHAYKILSGEQTVADLDYSDYETHKGDNFGETEEEADCPEIKANIADNESL